MPRNLKLALSSLDAKRLKSLHHLLYERTLLLNFIARTCYMTEAYAYTHLRFMLVAGDTLGHARMCELVHDDTLHDKIVQTSNTVANVPNIVNYGSIWTMLPFDLVRSDDDEYGNLMEDPCRPRYGGFTQGMDATELRCRAHAKALLHRYHFHSIFCLFVQFSTYQTLSLNGCEQDSLSIAAKTWIPWWSRQLWTIYR